VPTKNRTFDSGKEILWELINTQTGQNETRFRIVSFVKVKPRKTLITPIMKKIS
jgi:hypothetical protein